MKLFLHNCKETFKCNAAFYIFTQQCYSADVAGRPNHRRRMCLTSFFKKSRFNLEPSILQHSCRALHQRFPVKSQNMSPEFPDDNLSSSLPTHINSLCLRSDKLVARAMHAYFEAEDEFLCLNFMSRVAIWFWP